MPLRHSPKSQHDSSTASATKSPDNVTYRDKNKNKSDSSNTKSDPLKAFQSEIRDMFKSFERKQNERLAVLEKSISEVKAQNMTIQTTNSEIEKSVDFVSNQLKNLESKIDLLESDRKNLITQIQMVEERCEYLDRYSKKTSIELRNVPKRGGEHLEDLYMAVSKLTNFLQLDIRMADLRDVYRLPSRQNSKNSTIVAELSNTLQRNQILDAVRAYNKTNHEQINTNHLGMKCESTQVYISEHLTWKMKKLHYLAREFAKSEKFAYCWTTNGRIYLRKKSGEDPILVKTEEQLNNLKSKN